MAFTFQDGGGTNASWFGGDQGVAQNRQPTGNDAAQIAKIEALAPGSGARIWAMAQTWGATPGFEFLLSHPETIAMYEANPGEGRFEEWASRNWEGIAQKTGMRPEDQANFGAAVRDAGYTSWAQRMRDSGGPGGADVSWITPEHTRKYDEWSRMAAANGIAPLDFYSWAGSVNKPQTQTTTPPPLGPLTSGNIVPPPATAKVAPQTAPAPVQPPPRQAVQPMRGSGWNENRQLTPPAAPAPAAPPPAAPAPTRPNPYSARRPGPPPPTQAPQKTAPQLRPRGYQTPDTIPTPQPTVATGTKPATNPYSRPYPGTGGRKW